MNKFCFISSFAQTKVRVSPEDRQNKNFDFNIFDQTRIHYRQYEDVYKIAAYCMFDGNEVEIEEVKKNQTIIMNIIKNPSKLKDLMMSDSKYKENIKKLDTIGYTYILE